MDFISTPQNASVLARNLLLDVTFSNYASVWSGLVQIFVLVAAVLLGNLIRRVIPFMRKSLIPSALLGGTIVLLLKLIPAVNGFINNDLMEKVTYHCLALGFIATALKRNNGAKKTSTKTILETGVLQGGVYALQASLGIGVTIVLSLVAGFPLAAGGVLLALGYGQGTGQALTWGSTYETTYGFTGGATFGLSIAAIGFFVASIVGVVYLNILRKKGKLRVISAEEREIKPKLEDYVGDNEIADSDSVDKLTINVGMVLLLYGIVCGVMFLVNSFSKNGVALIWGFNFLLGSIFALLTRLVLNFLSKKKVLKKEPTNNYMLDRIGGVMFDMMIVAGVAAIDWAKFSGMWWQLLIICAVGAAATFVYVRFVANNIFKGYEQEGFISIFGMMTGTASNGMILLREIDPKLETPAASNLVLSGVPAIAFAGGLLVLLGYCPKGLTQAIITFAIVTVAWAVFTVILFRNKIFRRRKKAAATDTAETAENTTPTDEPPAETTNN